MYGMLKRQIQMIDSNDSWHIWFVFTQFPVHYFIYYLQLVPIYCLIHKKWKNNPQLWLQFYLVIYNLLLNMYRDVMENNKAWNEVIEMVLELVLLDSLVD